MADYPHRAVIEEEIRQIWQLLRYKYASGSKRAVQDAANHLEGFLKFIERNRPVDAGDKPLATKEGRDG